jgi:hypothetical protein
MPLSGVGRREGVVGDPELVRLRRHEVAVHQIRRRPCVLVAPRRRQVVPPGVV